MINLRDFFYMGGYGYYVFSAYGIVIIMLTTQWFLPWRRWTQYKQQQEQHESNS